MRNIDCRHYNRCLKEGAVRKLRDLPCGSCQFQDDKSYKMTRQDVHGLLKLLMRAWGSNLKLHDLPPLETARGHRIEEFY
jgi:hypothetical protein